MNYIKRDGKSALVSKNLQLFLGFLSTLGYSITAIDDYCLLYKVEKESFTKFLCSTDFNSSECSVLLKDKALTYMALEHVGISVPSGTYFFIGGTPDSTSIDGVISYLEETSYPIIIKPNDSMLGRGITMLEGYDEGLARKAVLRAKKHSSLILVQEYLMGQEFRIIAVEGEILIGVKKFQEPRLPEEVLLSDCTEFLDIVTRSMSSIGAAVCGYDIIVGHNYLKVLEVNSNPSVFPIERYISPTTLERYFLRLEQLLRRNYKY
jgi:glutathione synthase/RimK-type ligase-like ATP-grasp enzyme